MPRDPYSILGLDPDASPEAVRRAYINLAKTHHPDAGGDTTKFQEILWAYQIIMGLTSDQPSQEDQDQALMTSLIIGAFNSIISSPAFDPKHSNLLKDIDKTLASALGQITAAQKSTNSELMKA